MVPNCNERLRGDASIGSQHVHGTAIVSGNNFEQEETETTEKNILLKSLFPLLSPVIQIRIRNWQNRLGTAIIELFPGTVYLWLDTNQF
jgi:hypothetical protein